MLTPTPQHHLGLIAGMGAMLIDVCRTNRLEPDPLCFEMLSLLASDIKDQTDALLKGHDEARFQALWGDKGILSTAWTNSCDTSFDEGMDVLNPEEDAAFDAIEAAHPTIYSPKGME